MPCSQDGGPVHSSDLMKRRIIIGIHGIGNKPPQPLLKKWWQEALCEGLRRIGSDGKKLDFELVYWAHYLYSEPQDLCETNPEHPLFINHPYVPGRRKFQRRPPGWLTKTLLNWAELFLAKLFMTENRLFNFDRLGDYVIRKRFRDLELYFHKANVDLTEVGMHARNMIRQELAQVIRRHRKKEIMLISHSMGTVIAYDVLTQIVPEITVHSFITLGSPLGLPTIMKKIYSEQDRDFRLEKTLPTPGNITHQWLNFADLGDHIALNYRLQNDFHANSRRIAPKDVTVSNDYRHDGTSNPHKSYGYLRTPELAKIVQQFIAEAPVPLLKPLLKLARKLTFPRIRLGKSQMK